MKKVYLTFLALLAVMIIFAQESVPDFTKNGEIYFKFEIESSKLIPDLTKIISIDNLIENTIYAYANENEFNQFIEQGYAYELLPHPNEGFDPVMATFEQIQNSDALTYYPTYDAYMSMMYQFEADYPDLCDVFSIGQSVNGRELLVAKISDNVDTDEAEPEFFYTSSMHGDELTGFPLMLNLIDSLLSQYNSASRITNLVNSIEIYINPLANPDGTYYGGNSTVSQARRYNANNVDLNRNFPDVVTGQFPNTQPETFLFMNFAESRNFVMSANFHGGAEVCNYPWDHKYDFCADDLWWQYVCHEYADTCQAYSPSNYMNGFNDGITNGAAWYVIDGGRQDYMNYYHQCREVTLEISDTKLIPASLLDDHWEYNKRSLLNYMEQVLYGVTGIVTDAVSGLPIKAEVYVLSHEINGDSSWVYSDPITGNYHRLLNAGTYDIQFSAPCYETQVIQNVSVQNKVPATLHIQLQPNSEAVDFSANSTFVVTGGNVQFTDQSCGTHIGWYWTISGPGTPLFVGGSNSNSQNPIVQFNEAGTYDVSLTATSAAGLIQKQRRIISLWHPAPIVIFIIPILPMIL
ncbi:MAG: M14 family zinc carboxypeptidase [Bacteroidales bacterium]